MLVLVARKKPCSREGTWPKIGRNLPLAQAYMIIEQILYHIFTNPDKPLNLKEFFCHLLYHAHIFYAFQFVDPTGIAYYIIRMYIENKIIQFPLQCSIFQKMP